MLDGLGTEGRAADAGAGFEGALVGGLLPLLLLPSGTLVAGRVQPPLQLR
jgi:hypothetical protein